MVGSGGSSRLVEPRPPTPLRLEALLEPEARRAPFLLRLADGRREQLGLIQLLRALELLGLSPLAYARTARGDGSPPCVAGAQERILVAGAPGRAEGVRKVAVVGERCRLSASLDGPAERAEQRARW